METKKVILARFVDFDITPANMLLWQSDVRFPINYVFVEKFLENQFWQLFASILHILTIFLVNNGHRAIKVHVNLV